MKLGERPLFFTPGEFAALIRVSPRTVRRWIRGEELPARRFGRQLRIPAQAQEDFASVAPGDKEQDWAGLAGDSFAKDWDNEKDAAYDGWRERYGLPKGRRGAPAVSVH